MVKQNAIALLRHTFATQLVNAGCKITSIQRLLGHKRLQNTLTYARLHDQTIATDYYTAMAVIEARLQPGLPTVANGQGKTHETPAHLLELVTALQSEPLTQSQQTVLDELQQGLAALAGVVQEADKPPEQLVVNEQAIHPP